MENCCLENLKMTVLDTQIFDDFLFKSEKNFNIVKRKMEDQNNQNETKNRKSDPEIPQKSYIELQKFDPNRDFRFFWISPPPTVIHPYPTIPAYPIPLYPFQTANFASNQFPQLQYPPEHYPLLSESCPYPKIPSLRKIPKISKSNFEKPLKFPKNIVRISDFPEPYEIEKVQILKSGKINKIPKKIDLFRSKKARKSKRIS
ncbi:hypothetical protein B9Z55_015450 [Caenorhabditis nigoni]|uniref:Uncharacterized protein n=1 Tax=Caenorhabditis nigoni TaxID=1611254 RepID=A0A2G5UAJ7_9PELO|nr:hypothetical protein B9Z55_015450 [Caenorhabditis nigoni]